jgi:hypothetical protein
MARTAEPSVLKPERKKDAAVVSAIKQDSGQAEVGNRNVQDIIQSYFMSQYANPNKAAAAINEISKMVQSQKARPIKIGNTVFLLIQKGPGEVEFHTMSEESPKLLVKRLKTLYSFLKQSGFKKATSFTHDANLLKLGPMIGIPFKSSQGVMNYNGQPVMVYNIEVDIA